MGTYTLFSKFKCTKSIAFLVLIASTGCYDSNSQDIDDQNLVGNLRSEKNKQTPENDSQPIKIRKYFSNFFSNSDTKTESTETTYTVVLPRFERTLPASPSSQESPAVEGSTTPGAEVTLYSDSNCKLALAKGRADRQGQFKLKIKVELGSRTKIFAKADLNGFNSGCSTDYVSYKQDSIAAENPVWMIVPPSGVTPLKSIALKLSATAEDTLTIYSDSACKYSILENQPTLGPDTRNILLVLEDNKSYQLSAMTSDAAGNHSDCISSGQNLTQDSKPPKSPQWQSNTTVTRAKEIALFGAVEPAVEVEVYDGPGCTKLLGTTTSNNEGQFSLNARLKENEISTFSAKAIDLAKNESACSQPVTYKHESYSAESQKVSSLSPNKVTSTEPIKIR